MHVEGLGVSWNYSQKLPKDEEPAKADLVAKQNKIAFAEQTEQGRSVCSGNNEKEYNPARQSFTKVLLQAISCIGNKNGP